MQKHERQVVGRSISTTFGRLLTGGGVSWVWHWFGRKTRFSGAKHVQVKNLTLLSIALIMQAHSFGTRIGYAEKQRRYCILYERKGC